MRSINYNGRVIAIFVCLKNRSIHNIFIELDNGRKRPFYNYPSKSILIKKREVRNKIIYEVRRRASE